MKENSKGPLNALKIGENNAKPFRDPARDCTSCKDAKMFDRNWSITSI
jgi:hypothetical protein